MTSAPVRPHSIDAVSPSTTLYQDWCGVQIRRMLGESEAIAPIGNSTAKGGYREDLFRQLLEFFLPAGLRTTTGSIFHLFGDAPELQKLQHDIVIYDDAVASPIGYGATNFIQAEAVVGVIEVKSDLTKESLVRVVRRFRVLRESCRVPGTGATMFPRWILAFSSSIGSSSIEDPKSVADDSSDDLAGLCVLGTLSWLNLDSGPLVTKHEDGDRTHLETRRYLGAVVNQAIARSKERRERWPYLPTMYLVPEGFEEGQ